jgi:hypothetical protein
VVGDASSAATQGAGRAATKRDAGQAGAVKEILDKVTEKLRSDVVKATLGDYIRLVQLQKELDEEVVPKEIRVTWVEPVGVEPLVEELEREGRGRN